MSSEKIRQIGVRLEPELEELVETISRQINAIAKDGGILLKVKLPGK